MSTVITHADVKSSQISAVVIRCGCGNPGAHVGAVCPRPRRVENRGLVSFRHRNPVLNWLGNSWIQFKEMFWK